MGVVDYQEATEFVLSRFGICRGFNFRRMIILFLAMFCYSFDIVSWIYISGTVSAIVINSLFLVSTFIGSLGVAIYNYISLIIFTITTLLTSVGAIITVILLAADTLSTESVGSSINLSALIALMSIFASFQGIFAFLLLNVIKNIKIYATSGSVYMSFADDFDF